MKLFARTAVLALATLWGTAAAAQTVSMQFVNGGTHDDGHYYVGNYNGLENNTAVTLNCVDFFHEVHNGQVWTATATDLGTGNLANTRFGTAGVTNYEEQAYLTTFYGANSGNNAVVVAIQHAIWSFYLNPPSAFPTYIQNDLAAHSSMTDAGYWVNLANANYNKQAAGFYNQFVILTDTYGANGTQEFITTTPEPASIALLGTGLVGLLPVVRRRRR